MSVNDLRKDLLIDANVRGHRLQLLSTWGLFSPRQLDEGSLLLLDHVPLDDCKFALDIGCGYGVLGLSIAQRAPASQVHMVDKDFLAVDYAGINAEKNGLSNTHAYLSNGFSHIDNELRFDLIVSNLPAKVGNEFFQILFYDAHARMHPGGRLVVVTINGLRTLMKRLFLETFGNYKKLKQGRNYTVSMAVVES